MTRSAVLKSSQRAEGINEEGSSSARRMVAGWDTGEVAVGVAPAERERASRERRSCRAAQAFLPALRKA